MPFADYADFNDCLSKNGDKKDPAAYCSTIERTVEGKAVTKGVLSIAEKQRPVRHGFGMVESTMRLEGEERVKVDEEGRAVLTGVSKLVRG